MSEHIMEFDELTAAMFQSYLGEEIVRCRDCRYFTQHENKQGFTDDWCAKHDHTGWSVDGFCAWGERREK